MDEKQAGPSTPPTWMKRREKVVQRALDDGDLAQLRKISALPGGFGSEEMRRRVWPVLLRSEAYFADDDADLEPRLLPEHKDEQQVLLDTKRSFVTYPAGIPPEDKDEMQADLQDLIVGILRKYPTLSYFQGFHDIMSVLYLTFVPPPLPISRPGSRRRGRSRSASMKGSRPPSANGEWEESDPNGEKQFSEKDEEGTAQPRDRDTEAWRRLRRCAEIVSLCRVRDAMGSGLEPMMGLLRILKRILRKADPRLAKFSSQISPVPTLPFFALSWILCLFSHDVDTLEPIQRLFDFVLARNPISAIYLAVAILIAKKPQMLKLVKRLGADVRNDPSLLHPLFARLPPLYPDTPDRPSPPESMSKDNMSIDLQDMQGDGPNPYDPIPLSELFALTDKLMSQYPWDGRDIRGTEIMGPGSVVRTYDAEAVVVGSVPVLGLVQLANMVDEDVVMPGSSGAEEDEDEEEDKALSPSFFPRFRLPRLRFPTNRLGTAVAVGVVVIGIGIAVYGVRAGGPRASWSRWWGVVISGWAGRFRWGVTTRNAFEEAWKRARGASLQ